MGEFYHKLTTAWTRRDSLLCVGIDPDPARMPGHLGAGTDRVFRFGIEIIDAVAEHACAFKLQAACYHALGAEAQLRDTIAHVRRHHPGHVVILDAKRGDIGATARYYAAEAFDRHGADAVTASPYLGGDALAPFLERADRGVFVLCRTSNPGSADLQERVGDDGAPLWRHVARLAAGAWNGNGNVGLVAGATWPDALGEIRREVGGMPLLVPGIGAQGGDLAAVLGQGLAADGAGLLISASRSILYADSGPRFAAAAADAAAALRRDIQRARVGKAA